MNTPKTSKTSSKTPATKKEFTPSINVIGETSIATFTDAVNGLNRFDVNALVSGDIANIINKLLLVDPNTGAKNKGVSVLPIFGHLIGLKIFEPNTDDDHDSEETSGKESKTVRKVQEGYYLNVKDLSKMFEFSITDFRAWKTKQGKNKDYAVTDSKSSWMHINLLVPMMMNFSPSMNKYLNDYLLLNTIYSSYKESEEPTGISIDKTLEEINKFPFRRIPNSGSNILEIISSSTGPKETPKHKILCIRTPLTINAINKALKKDMDKDVYEKLGTKPDIKLTNDIAFDEIALKTKRVSKNIYEDAKLVVYKIDKIELSAAANIKTVVNALIEKFGINIPAPASKEHPATKDNNTSSGFRMYTTTISLPESLKPEQIEKIKTFIPKKVEEQIVIDTKLAADKPPKATKVAKAPVEKIEKLEPKKSKGVVKKIGGFDDSTPFGNQSKKSSKVCSESDSESEDHPPKKSNKKISSDSDSDDDSESEEF